MQNLQEKAKRVLAYMQDQGADQAACALDESILTEINYLNGKFSLFRTLVEEASNVELIKDQRYSSLTGNRLEDEDLKALVDECFKGASSADPDEARRFVPKEEAVQKSAQTGVLTADPEAMFELLVNFIKDVEETYETIVISELYLSHDYDKSVEAYSSGAEFSSESGAYNVTLNCSSVVGDQSSSFFYNGLTTQDLKTPLIEREPFKSDLSKIADQYKAEALEENFKGKLIMTPACLGNLLYYLVANFTGNSSILTQSSLWQDKLGEQVIDDQLTLKVAPFDDRFIGGSLATAEGFEAENYTLFDKGVLKSFSISDYVARKTGKERAKNSEFYSNWILESEETQALEELIAGVDKGIYMMRFSGGSPATNGDFSGVAKNSFLIEDGKITKPLREVMISGNLADLFSQISGYSTERINDGNSDLPWLVFDNVFISGK